MAVVLKRDGPLTKEDTPLFASACGVQGRGGGGGMSGHVPLGRDKVDRMNWGKKIWKEDQ